MIYMREYFTKVNYDGEKDSEGRYPLVADVYTYKTHVRPDPRVDTYTWEDINEFHDQRCSRSCDYIGKLFGGLVCCLNRHHGIKSFQLFKDTDDFPEVIESPGFETHMDAVVEAWIECQTSALKVVYTDKGSEPTPEHVANVSKLKELRSKVFPEKDTKTA